MAKKNLILEVEHTAVRGLLLPLLAQYNGNVAAVARVIGITRQGLLQRMQRMGLRAA